jgi:hypothetical protein
MVLVKNMVDIDAEARNSVGGVETRYETGSSMLVENTH